MTPVLIGVAVLTLLGGSGLALRLSGCRPATAAEVEALQARVDALDGLRTDVAVSEARWQYTAERMREISQAMGLRPPPIPQAPPARATSARDAGADP